jgi:SlyX protein
MSEDRLEKIESKVAFLENTVDDLSKTIYEQQKQIGQLHAVITSLVTHVRNLSDSVGERGAPDEKPPHY